MILDIYHKSSSDMEQWTEFICQIMQYISQTNTYLSNTCRVVPKHLEKPFDKIKRNTNKELYPVDSMYGSYINIGEWTIWFQKLCRISIAPCIYGRYMSPKCSQTIWAKHQRSKSPQVPGIAFVFCKLIPLTSSNLIIQRLKIGHTSEFVYPLSFPRKPDNLHSKKIS